ncbi:hypothetical protein N2152v2_001418 [Parachlorella kessleri]
MVGRVLNLPIAQLRTGNLEARADDRALGYMGLCDAMTKAQAEDYLRELDSWSISENAEGHLLISREWRAKSFVKALELCDRIAEVAEEQGHHPDLHITGWNRLRVDLTTHARDGLTENDFIVAAKLDAIPKEDLLRKRKKATPDA